MGDIMFKDDILLEINPKDFSADRRIIFTAGIPGAGKTTISKLVLGGLGFKEKDTDDILVSFLKKNNISTKMDELTPEEQYILKNLRDDSFDLVKKYQNYHSSKGKGIIFHTSGQRKNWVTGILNTYLDMGYQAKMLFVDVDLETALLRNRKRSRSVPESAIIETHKWVQMNKEYYRNLFGPKNFHYINTTNLVNVNVNNPEIDRLYKEFLNWKDAKFVNEYLRRMIREEILKII